MNREELAEKMRTAEGLLQEILEEVLFRETAPRADPAQVLALRRSRCILDAAVIELGGAVDQYDRDLSAPVNADALRACRKRTKMSQAEFGAMLGYDRATVARWEGGRPVTNPRMLRLALAGLGETI